jgi:urocanate hydratase
MKDNSSIAGFRKSIQTGIPETLPAAYRYDPDVNHAPKRKKVLTPDEEKLALRNALR